MFACLISAAVARPSLLPGTLVVVEGDRDAEVVRSAVDAEVAVTCGTPPKPGHARYTTPPRAVAALTAAAARASRVVVLADCDAGGRAMRSAVEALFLETGHGHLPLAHAFLPGAESRCRSGPRLGAVGVQYARPGSVRAALATARTRDLQRAEFTRAHLLSWGLAGTHGEAPPTGGVAARRDAVASALGFGGCDGKTFLKYLNAFGWTHEEVQQIVQTLGPAAVDSLDKAGDAG